MPSQRPCQQPRKTNKSQTLEVRGDSSPINQHYFLCLRVWKLIDSWRQSKDLALKHSLCRRIKWQRHCWEKDGFSRMKWKLEKLISFFEDRRIKWYFCSNFCLFFSLWIKLFFAISKINQVKKNYRFNVTFSKDLCLDFVLSLSVELLGENDSTNKGFVQYEAMT